MKDVALAVARASSSRKLALPFRLGATFEKDRVVEVLSASGKVNFDKVPPIGRHVKGVRPESPSELLQQLAAALVPIVDDYPLPFVRAGS